MAVAGMVEKNLAPLPLSLDDLDACVPGAPDEYGTLSQACFNDDPCFAAGAARAKEAPAAPASANGDLKLLELAAHDLRNPISGILAATQYLIEDAGKMLEADHLTLLRSVESSARFMLRLLQDMVEIPNIGSGELALELHSTDIGLLIQQAAAANRSFAESRKIDVQVRIETPLPLVSADLAMLSHAAEGLLVSAIRASVPGGGIDISVAGNAEAVTSRLTYEPRRSARTSQSAGELGNQPRRRLSDEWAALTFAHMKRIVEAHGGSVLLETRGQTEFVIVVSLPVNGGGKSRGRLASERRRAPKTRAAG